MDQRRVFSIRYFNRIFFKYAKIALALTLFLSLIRFNLFFLTVNTRPLDVTFFEVYMSFFTGLRFDLLVMGFFLIPPVIIHALQGFLVKWSSWDQLIFKIYLSVLWTLSIILNWIDFLTFSTTGVRARWEDYIDFWNSSLVDTISTHAGFSLSVFSGALFLMLLLGLYVIRSVEFGEWRDLYSPHKGTRKELTWRIIFPLLLVALAARGTLEEVHLEYRHSLISNEIGLNELSLNPMWCLDKSK